MKAVRTMREKAAYALSNARGVPIEHDLRAYERTAATIQAVDYSGAEEAALAAEAGEARERIRAGADLDGELVRVFALVAEACRRRLGLEPFREQLVAGIVMHGGKLAQMQTGEGKTLAAVFPACLNALAGAGVHVLTANDYLARRDAEWMRPVYELLGVSVHSIGAGASPAERRAAYEADVTYLTAREAGFDYLRDQLCQDARELVQPDTRAMALVDEADFIMIDEARIPLVIAGATESDDIDPRRVDEVARDLRPGIDYRVDREGRTVGILLPGHRTIEQALGVGGIHEPRGADCFARVHAALHARALLRRDVDYVVRGGRVELVDEFTGRIAERRQWPWGIQAAIEAKEGLALQPEGRVYGSITLQNYLGLYEKVAAMTATAVPSAEELAELYGLATVIVPTVKTVRRIDQPDVVFATRREKVDALLREISVAHAAGRPVLVGTASVRESREIADLLRAAGIRCEVLNASNDEQEAALIASAGLWGAVTISTNMAGRGTDIRLGDDQRVIALGGLYVIGTNRHESRRVDDQLRGRAGRQGEPGTSRYFISLEDPLFERYGVRELLPRGCPLTDLRVAREIDRAQSIIEAQNHAIRRTLRKYARLVELDRRAVRQRRDAALRQSVLPEAIDAACPPAALRSLVTQVYLGLLDRFWADHLQLVEEVREGIDLERFAGRDPGLEYIHRVGSAFEEGMRRVERETLAVCERLRADPGAARIEDLGITRPSSTWTYQVDDEAPVRFNLGLLAGSSIGLASFVLGPLLPLKALAGLVQRIVTALRRR